MKRLTLSADAELIDRARGLAKDRGTTLNELIRLWLADYVNRREQADRAMQAIDELRKTVRLHGPFTRDELNRRR